MAKRSLEEDKERFVEWRSRKHGRERIPDELWQMASAHIPALGLNRVAQEFRLDFVRLRERAKQFGIGLPKKRTGPGRGGRDYGSGFPGTPIERDVGGAPFCATFCAMFGAGAA